MLGKYNSASEIKINERPNTSFKRKSNLKRRKVIKDYLKRQNFTLAREIPLPLLAAMKKDSNYPGPNLLN